MKYLCAKKDILEIKLITIVYVLKRKSSYKLNLYLLNETLAISIGEYVIWYKCSGTDYTYD